MSKKMLINATYSEESRVAIVEDGILSELDIEVTGKEQTKGNIYKATVVRVESGLQAAFIDYGAERLGFLQMGEIHPSYFKSADPQGENKGRLRISDVLRRGQDLLVQVVKGERGNKGAALTTFLSLPGRYMVLMPESDTKGVSRKIEEESKRKKLKEAMASLDLPSQMGYIVRTAGIGQSKEELKRDFDYLVRVYNNIQALAAKTKGPALIYKESNLVIRCIRDYFSAEMDEVLVDDPKTFQEARDFFEQVMPEYAALVKLHQEKRPIFSRYQIEEQIETIVRNKVPLPSGGSIVIDSTEALVAVDVNSGKMASEQGVEATAYKSNLEAATEVARQLRLRDLGGLIVIDFIDMRDRKHIREVEKRLKDGLKNDKARVSVGKISQFGLLEMSRQRIKATLAEGTYLTCPHCAGNGRIKSPEAQGIAFLRRIQGGIAKGHIGRVEGVLPLDVALYLLNQKREELFTMEHRHQIRINITANATMIAGEMDVEFFKREKEEEEVAPITALTVATSIDDEAPAPEPVAEEETSTDDAEESAETSEGGGKKKRRRRRRKKSGSSETGDEANGEEVSDDEETPESAEEPADAAESDDDSAAGAGDEAETTEESGEVKKKRRRRRRKKSSASSDGEAESTPASTETAEESSDTSAPGDEAEEAPGETTDAPEGEKRTPRKRSRSRRKKSPTATGEGASNEAAEAVTTETPRETVIPEAAAPQETAVVKEEPQAPAVAEAAPEVKVPARKRRPSKKAATTEDAAVTIEPATETAAAPLTAAPAAPSEEAPAPKKPAAKRTSRPRTKTEPAQAPAAPQTDAATPPVEETADAPKKPTRRRSTKKVEEATTEATAAAPASAAGAADAPKKPARRRSTKKTDEPTGEPAPLAAAAETAPPQKPARRRTTKKAEEPKGDAPAAPATVEADAPKKPTRRRSTKKESSES